MVCDRCKMAVRQVLRENGLHSVQINLGEVELTEDDISHVYSQLSSDLEQLGFELLDNEKSKLIEKVKTMIRELVHEKNNDISVNLSAYLSDRLKKDYSAVSHLFSQVEGITIEKYYVLQKLEKVKELLVYNELTLDEIADRLNYSSAAYMSNQFKKITGFTPGQFRKLQDHQRKEIDAI